MEVYLTRRRWFLVLSSFLVLSVSSASGQEATPDKLRIAPAPGSSTDPGGSYFVLESKPGETLRQKLQITNRDNRSADIEVSAVDVATASTGGVAFELPTNPVDDEGSWLDIERKRLALATGGTAQVPFRVHIPKDTESGVHLAGLAVQLADKGKPDPSPTSGAAIDIQSRFVVAVQVTLPGNSTPEIAITGVEPVVGTSGISLEVLIENVGFGLTVGEGVLELPEEGFEEPLKLGTFVPGTAIRYPVTWLPDPPEGEYAARVQLSYAEDDPELLTGRASWEGTFVIGEGQVAELDQLQGDEGFNWLLVILPALLLLVGGSFFLWRRRHQTAPVGVPPAAGPANEPQPAPAPASGYGGGYTGSAGGTFGSGTRPPEQSAPPPVHQRPPGAPPPPPPPPKQGP